VSSFNGAPDNADIGNMDTSVLRVWPTIVFTQRAIDTFCKAIHILLEGLAGAMEIWGCGLVGLLPADRRAG